VSRKRDHVLASVAAGSLVRPSSYGRVPDRSAACPEATCARLVVIVCR